MIIRDFIQKHSKIVIISKFWPEICMYMLFLQNQNQSKNLVFCSLNFTSRFIYNYCFGLLNRIVWYKYLCDFNLNHSSIHLWGMYTVNTQLLSNHSCGRLLPSLQSVTPIQTEFSDDGVRKPIPNYDVFWCKNLDNILSGSHRTGQSKKQRKCMTPLKK